MFTSTKSKGRPVAIANRRSAFGLFCNVSGGVIRKGVALVCASSTLLLSAEGSGPGKRRAPIPAIQFISPSFGANASGSDFTISVQLNQAENPSTLTVNLNGNDISSRITSSSCDAQSCTLSGTVGVRDGAKPGQNLLTASVKGWVPNTGAVKRSKFFYQETLLGGNTLSYYEPDSVGISTDYNADAWVKITTGSMINVQDPVASLPALPAGNDGSTTTTFSVPYPDKTFGTSCSNNLRAVVLQRQAPSVLEATACEGSAADIQNSLISSLNRPLNNTDLVLLSTAPGYSAPAGLDTTFIGGTNFANVSPYPIGYMIIGVPGAKAGTAHESYYVAAGWDTPSQYLPFLNGTLMLANPPVNFDPSVTIDKNPSYNYMPSDQRDFVASSIAGSSQVRIGGQVYLPPAGAGNGAFWLLVMDRELLQPINYTTSSGTWTNCQFDLGSQTCGGIFDVRSDGGAALGQLLSSISPRNLVFLLSQGAPFDYSAQVNANFAHSVAMLGGSAEAMQTLSLPAMSAYSLVSVNDQQHTHALTDNVALSASQFVAQGQTGAVHGFLARGKSGLYDVAGKDQMALTTDSNGNKLPVGGVDYTFGQTASAQRQDWPLTDTPGHLAAYHDISKQLLTDSQVNKFGSYLYDIRYFYTDSSMVETLNSILDSRLGDNATNPVKQSSWNTFSSPQDFIDARQQILEEIQAMHSAASFLYEFQAILSNGLGSTGMMSTVLNVANAISADEANAGAQLVDTSASNSLNLAAGLMSMFSLLPDVGPLLGLISGALWTGSASAAGLYNSIPAPENAFDVTLTDLMSNASDYAANLVTSYSGAVTNILTDPGKLQTIGGLASNTNSGWKIGSNFPTKTFTNALAAGEARSLWQQIMPKLYGVRYFLGMSGSNPAKYGSRVEGIDGRVCSSVYQGIPNQAYASFLSFGTVNKYDTYIMAEGTNASTNDVPVSSNLLNVWTSQAGLNLPFMLLFSNSNMNYSPGAYFVPNATCTVP